MYERLLVTVGGQTKPITVEGFVTDEVLTQVVHLMTTQIFC